MVIIDQNLLISLQFYGFKDVPRSQSYILQLQYLLFHDLDNFTPEVSTSTFGVIHVSDVRQISETEEFAFNYL